MGNIIEMIFILLSKFANNLIIRLYYQLIYCIILEYYTCVFILGILLLQQENRSFMSDNCLPENYAERMFDLEAILDYDTTIQAIRQLNDHYRAGIDYFIEKDQRKATHLQKKMTCLLANPDNIRILQRQSKKGSQKVQPITKVECKKQAGTKISAPSLNTRKLNQEVTKFHTVADSYIKSIVENCNKMADKAEKLMNKDLNKQQEQLNGRIMLKRMKSQQKMLKITSQTNIPNPIIKTAGLQKGAQMVQTGPLKNFIQ